MTFGRTKLASLAALGCAGAIAAGIAVGAEGDRERGEDARAGKWTALQPATFVVRVRWDIVLFT
jgi:hypothetical protein